MKAKEVEIEDVFTDSHGNNFMVRGVDTSDTEVKLRLSAGRTDRGDWYKFDPETEVAIFRKPY